MDFGKLRAFIDDSLGASRGTENRPGSKDECLELLEILARKGGVDWKRGDGHPNRSYDLKRRELKVELIRVQNELAEASRKPPSSTREANQRRKKARKELQRKRDTLKREIPRLDSQRNSRPGSRPKIIARIFGDIERADFSTARASGGSGMVRLSGGTKQLSWSVLPPGELSLSRVLAHYEKLGRKRPDVRYEPERIRNAWSLGPRDCYVGSDEFDGYMVFTFSKTNKVLLERPVYGNAIYVLGGDWKRLSKLSKRELLADHTREVIKIVHTGDWLERTKLALGLR